MFDSPSGLRNQGVTSASTPSETGDPRTVLGVADFEWKAAFIYDENGQRRTIILAIVGGEYYVAPDSDAWAKRLKPAADWLKNNVKQRIAARQSEVEGLTSVPSQDSVNVVG